MKNAIILTGVVACLSLSACASTTTTKLLDNLQGCSRHYDGAVAGGMTGGSFSGTIKVDCQPGHGVVQVQPAAPPLQPGGT